MKKEIDKKLEKAKQVAELRKNGTKISDIMKSMNLTYAEYKKLEQIGRKQIEE